MTRLFLRNRKLPNKKIIRNFSRLFVYLPSFSSFWKLERPSDIFEVKKKIDSVWKDILFFPDVKIGSNGSNVGLLGSWISLLWSNRSRFNGEMISTSTGSSKVLQNKVRGCFKKYQSQRQSQRDVKESNQQKEDIPPKKKRNFFAYAILL